MKDLVIEEKTVNRKYDCDHYFEQERSSNHYDLGTYTWNFILTKEMPKINNSEMLKFLIFF